MKKKIARSLRQRQTPAEALLWNLLRNRQWHGLKFLRQHPLSFKVGGRVRTLVADFYCHEKRLVLEVDGPVHDQQQEKDAARDALMRTAGLTVVRLTNAEIEQGAAEALGTRVFLPLLFAREGGRGDEFNPG